MLCLPANTNPNFKTNIHVDNTLDFRYYFLPWHLGVSAQAIFAQIYVSLIIPTQL